MGRSSLSGQAPAFERKLGTHTVLIIDNSGSMNISDVVGMSRHKTITRTRHEAVFNAIQHDLIEPQLKAGTGPNDLLSLILFSAGAVVALKHVQFADAEAGCSYFRNAYPPYLDGTHYLAACAALRDLLAAQGPCTFTAVNVLFFSDGQPTDHLRTIDGSPLGMAPIALPTAEEVQALERGVVDALLDACSSSMHALPATFKFHAIGFGSPSAMQPRDIRRQTEFFRLLSLMVDSLPRGVGAFHQSSLDSSRLNEAMQEFSASVTETRLTSTAADQSSGDAAASRVLRPVHFLRQRMPTDDTAPSEWITYRRVVAHHAPPSLNATFERAAGTVTLQVSRCAFDGGAERNVFHARVSPEGEGCEFDGADAHGWVAKEGRHVVGYDSEIRFHKSGLVTQATCAAFAADFNMAVAQCTLRERQGFCDARPDSMFLPFEPWPRIEVNRCYLVVADARPLFLEPRIDGAPFSKWNTNHGAAHEGVRGAFSFTIHKKSESTTLGIVLVGDVSAPPVITNIRPGHAAYLCPYLKAGMSLLRINGEPTFGHMHATALLKQAVGDVTLLVEERAPRTASSQEWQAHAGMGNIREEEDDDDDDDDDDEAHQLATCYKQGGDAASLPSGDRVAAQSGPCAADVPQAFTHWTYHVSNATRMACDLQGFYLPGSHAAAKPDTAACAPVRTPAKFVLVDPAFHSRCVEGESGFGRTDRGTKGFVEFFRTHTCNALCRALALPPTGPSDVPGASDQAEERWCVICEEEPRQVRFVCGHACVCIGCAHKLRASHLNACPMCETPLGDAPFQPVGHRKSTFVATRERN